MSSVDERVVEMRFDNAQFEKGVSKTLGTLDRLKEGLKFSGAIDGLGSIQNAINGLKLNNIENSIDKLNGKFSGLGIAATEVVKRITNSALNAVTKLTTAIPNQIKQGGWNRALNIENARFQLEGLKVAWDDVSKDLSYAVNGTAYGLDSAAKAAAQLTASGIKASSTINLTSKNVDDMADKLLGVSSAEAKANNDLDDMAVALRAISGVAAMTNSSYDDIASVFTRIAGQGRVMAVDLNSLAGRGLNAAATLAEIMGTSEEEVRNMVHDGKIDFQTFSEAMYDAFADHAIEANNTFQGALSNTKAALSKIGAEVADDVLPAATRVLNAVRKMINSIKTAIMPILNSLGKLIVALGETIGRIFDSLRGKLDAATNSGKKVLKPIQMISNVIDKMTEKVTDFGVAVGVVSEEKAAKLKGSTEEVGKAADQAAQSVEELVAAVIRGDYGNGAERIKALGDAYGLIQNKVNESLNCTVKHEEAENALTAATNLNSKAVKTNAEIIAERNKELKKQAAIDMVKGFTNIGKTLAAAIKSIASAIGDCFKNVKAINLAGAASKWKEFTGVIVDNASALTYMNNVIFDIVHSIANVIKAIGKVIGALVKAIAETLSELSGFSLKSQTQAWRDFTESLIMSDEAAKGLKDIFKALLSPLKVIIPLVSTASKALLKLGTAFGKLINRVLEFVGKSKMLQAINNLFTKLVTTVTTFFSALKKTEGFQKFIEASKELWSTIGNKLIKLFDKLANKLGDINGKPTTKAVKGINKVSDAFGKCFGAISKLLGGIKKLISGETKIGDIFKRVGKNIAEAFSKIDFADFFSKFDFLGLFKGLSKNIKDQSAKMDFTSAFSSLKDSIRGSYVSSVQAATKDAPEEIQKTVIDEAEKPTGFIGILKLFFASIGARIAAIPWAQIGKAIQNGLGMVIHKTAEIFRNDDLRTIVNGVYSLLFLFALLKNLVAASKLTKAATKVTKSLSGLIGAIKAKIMGTAGPKPSKLKNFAVTVAILAGTFAGLAILAHFLDREDLDTALQYMMYLLTLLTVVNTAIGALSKTINVSSYNTIANASMKLTAGVLMMVHVLNVLRKWNMDEYTDAIDKLLGILFVMSACTIAINFFSKKEIKTNGFISMAVALALLIIPLTILAALPWKFYTKGLIRMILLLGMMTAVIVVINQTSKKAKKCAATAGILAAFALDIVAMSLGMLVLAFVPWKRLLVACAALGGTMIALGVALKIASGKQVAKSAKLAAAMAVEVVAIAVALSILASMPLENVIAAAAAISGTIIAIAAGLQMASKGHTSKTMIKNAILIAVTAVTIGSTLYGLAKFNWKSLAGAGIGLAASILAVGMALKFASSKKGIDIKSTIALVVTAVVMAGILAELSKYDWASLIAAGAAIGVALMAVGLSLSYASKSKVDATAVLTLAVTAVIIGAVINQLAQYDWQSLLAAAAALGVAIMSIGVGLAIMDNVHVDVGPIFGMIAAALSIGYAISLIAQYDWQSLLASAASIGIVMLALSASLAILSLVKVDLVGTLSAAVSMAAILAAVGLVFDLIMNLMPAGRAEDILTTAKALVLITTVLGGFVAILGLIPLPLCLTAIAAAALIGVAIDAIMVIVSGGLLAASYTFPTIGKNLEALADSLKKFCETVATSDGERAADVIKSIGVGIAALSGGNLLDGINDFFGNGLSDKLPKLGEAVKGFADNCKGISYNDARGIDAVADAVSALAEIKSKKVDSICDSLDKFCKTLKSYVDIDYDALANGASTVGNFVDSIQTAADKAKGSSEELSENTTNPLAGLSGDITKYLDDAGGSITTGMPELSDLMNGQLDGLFNSTNTTITEGMPELSGLMNGQLDGLFNSTNTTITEGMTANGKNAIDLNGMNIDSLLEQFAGSNDEFVNATNGINTSILTEFGSQDTLSSYGEAGTNLAGAFGESLGSYDMSGDVTDLASNAVKQFSSPSVINSLVDAGTKNAQAYATPYKSSEKPFTELMDEFNAEQDILLGISNDSLPKFGKSGEANAGSYAGGMNNSTSMSLVGDAGTDLAKQAQAGAYDNGNSVQQMQRIGSNMSRGFANAVDEYGYLANKNAKKMVSDAIAAAKKEADEHSPSKKTYQIGKFFVLGMSNAIKDYGNLVSDETKSTITSALDNMSSMASEAAYEIEHGFDGIAPTISPVVDLTNVRRSAYAMGSLFDTARFNAGAIQYDLAHGYQNGSLSGTSMTTNNNAVTNNITVNAAPGQSVKEIADAVSNRLSFEYQKKRSVFA